MTTGYFAEDGTGHVKHNSLSSVFIRNLQAGGALQWCLNVELKCSMEYQKSLQLDPLGEQRDKTPLSLAHQDDQGRPTMWSLLEKNDSFRSYFHSLMLAECSTPMYELNRVVRAFDWKQIETLVDVSTPCFSNIEDLGFLTSSRLVAPRGMLLLPLQITSLA
jgi:6-hydroxytryprostatin B O-methyltransferase